MTQSHTTDHLRRHVTRLLCAAGLTVAGIAGGGVTGVLGSTSAGAATPVPDLCSGTTVMPPSTGTETPAGFTIQMPGAVLAPATDANTLAQAYGMWNDMTCTEYTHQYQFAPPKYYYLDCVGFTGYATEKADPTAWASVASDLHIAAGFVPTPVNFEQFFNDLPTSPQAGWQAVDGVSGIQPGDILAWQPALSNGQPNLAGTGHSVMPLTAPVAVPGSDGTRWELVIMDSTAGGHGPDDTRKPDDPLSERNAPILTTSGQVQPSGLGIGTIALDTTPAGEVTGVEWNVGDPPESIVFGAGHPLDDPSPAPPGPQPVQSSYDIAGANGMVDSFGSAANYGPGVPLTLNAPVVGLATSTDGYGYWETAADGGVFNYGRAPFLGSMGGQHLNAPVVGIAGTRDEDGYWLAAADGGVFAFGSAPFLGSEGGVHLNAPVVGIAATPEARGYWLVAADGGVFSYGDASFYGSMGGQALAAPIVGIATTTDGLGYWLVGADGGVFAFGDATFYGRGLVPSLDGSAVAIAATNDGGGYWEFTSEGEVVPFGDATEVGNASASPLVPVAAGASA